MTGMNKINEQSLWWDNTLPLSIPDTSLPQNTNVVIVGAGFSGLSAAMELRRCGVEVTLIEKEWPGNGACSRNLGLVMDRIDGTTTGELDGLVHGVKKYELIKEGRRAHDYVIELIKRENISCGLRQRGKLILATTKSVYETIATSLERIKEKSGVVDAYMVPKQELYKEIGGQANKFYCGAKVEPNAYDLNPGQLTGELVQRLIDSGTTICSSTQLESMQRHANGSFTISTNQGNITAEHVVLATQGYSGAETGFLQKKIFPLLAHVVATEPIPEELMSELLPTLRGVVDTKQMFYNFRPCDKESRLILASHYCRTDDNSTQSNRILNAYRKLFPELAKVKAEYCWHGNLALPGDHLPHIGIRDGVHFCATPSFSMALYLGSKIAKRILKADDASTLLDNMPAKDFPFYSGNPSLHYPALRMLFHGLDYLKIAAPR
ncbi:MAG: FAD-dependent oxidoreductase [Gammaproteobacteria bacterium]|nr:FAD-dependent oxidoreductase [Gammaproteobacteria bacterium]